MSLRTPDPDPGWLSEDDFREARRRLPMVYVDVVPVQVDGSGQVTAVGLLLRAGSKGQMTRTLVSGRVSYGESIRQALRRHIEKDLGPMAFPQLPTTLVPVTVTEYFPHPEARFNDPRQHAVSLCYVVPVSGTCEPRQDALEVTWLPPTEALSPLVVDEMEGGRGALVRAALAHVGAI